MRQLSIISHETSHHSNNLKSNEKCIDENETKKNCENAHNNIETKCSLDMTTDKKDLDTINSNNSSSSINSSNINVITNNYNNSNNKIQINFITYNNDINKNTTTTTNTTTNSKLNDKKNDLAK